MWQNFPRLTSLENTFANHFIVGYLSCAGDTEIRQGTPPGWALPEQTLWVPHIPTPTSPEQVQAMPGSLTLCLCRSSGSPPLLTRPRSAQACRTRPNRNTSSGSARSQKPPPAWCRAAPPPGTSRWKLPGRRSAGGQQRRHRQSAWGLKRAREGVCTMIN